jgi:SAM-dependent methyltransferase
MTAAPAAEVTQPRRAAAAGPALDGNAFRRTGTGTGTGTDATVDGLRSLLVDIRDPQTGDGGRMSEALDLYDNVYSDFASAAEAAVRHHAFGEDIGQSSWLTAGQWLRFADQTQVGKDSHVLEVGSGSGGPAVYLARTRGCRVTGIDINEHGVRNAERLSAAQGLADRVTFQIVDGNRPLPFAPAAFDAILSNDAMCHISKRLEILTEWHRVVRPGGRILFTDAMVVTGVVSGEELAARSSIGFYLFLPPGENERLIRKAGFNLLESEDLTRDAEAIARRWREARETHRDELLVREGAENFSGLQRFLACVQTLSAERRLSRFSYLAEKPHRRTAEL